MVASLFSFHLWRDIPTYKILVQYLKIYTRGDSIEHVLTGEGIGEPESSTTGLNHVLELIRHEGHLEWCLHTYKTNVNHKLNRSITLFYTILISLSYS